MRLKLKASTQLGVVAAALPIVLTSVVLPTSAQAANSTPYSGEYNASTTSPRTVVKKAPKHKKRHRYGTLTIPDARVRNLPIVRYRGTPDDGPGTLIQNRSILSAPHRNWGGVAPGRVGSFFLAGHRSSHGAPLLHVPGLHVGDRIIVKRNGVRYVYIFAYRLTANFRSKASKRAQLAPVPGYPGVPAVSPAIVVSTCATPEDYAAGLRWQDRFGNPTHRFNMVGFLKGTKAYDPKAPEPVVPPTP